MDTVRADAADGAFAGALAGIPTGVLTAHLGMLPTLAMDLGGHNPIIGAVVHLAVATILGAGFGYYLGPATHLRDLITAGLLYGVVWWVVIPLLLIPAWVSENTSLVVVHFAVMSMAGQAIFGPLVGLLLYWLRRRRGPTSTH